MVRKSLGQTGLGRQVSERLVATHPGWRLQPVVSVTGGEMIFPPILRSRPRLPARPGKHSEPDPPASYPGYSQLPNLFLSLRGFWTIPNSLGEPILPLENCTNSSKPIPASLDAYCSTSRFQDFSGGLELPPPHFLSRQPQPSPQAPGAPFGGVLFPGCPATFHRLIKRNKINPHYKSELRQTSNSRSGGCAHYSPARWQ